MFHRLIICLDRIYFYKIDERWETLITCILQQKCSSRKQMTTYLRTFRVNGKFVQHTFSHTKSSREAIVTYQNCVIRSPYPWRNSYLHTTYYSLTTWPNIFINFTHRDYISHRVGHAPQLDDSLNGIACPCAETLGSISSLSVPPFLRRCTRGAAGITRALLRRHLVCRLSLCNTTEQMSTALFRSMFLLDETRAKHDGESHYFKVCPSKHICIGCSFGSPFLTLRDCFMLVNKVFLECSSVTKWQLISASGDFFKLWLFNGYRKVGDYLKHQLPHTTCSYHYNPVWIILFIFSLS